MRRATLTFGEHESYMAKDGSRVKICPTGKAFVLRVRRSTRIMAAVDGEPTCAGVTADGPGLLQGRRSAGKKARDVRRCSRCPSEAGASKRVHAVSLRVYHVMCNGCIAKNNQKRSVALGRERGGSNVQAGLFPCQETERCNESRAPVVTLIALGVYGGAVATAALRSKTDEHRVRFVNAFMGSVGPTRSIEIWIPRSASL